MKTKLGLIIALLIMFVVATINEASYEINRAIQCGKSTLVWGIGYSQSYHVSTDKQGQWDYDILVSDGEATIYTFHNNTYEGKVVIPKDGKLHETSTGQEGVFVNFYRFGTWGDMHICVPDN